MRHLRSDGSGASPRLRGGSEVSVELVMDPSISTAEQAIGRRPPSNRTTDYDVSGAERNLDLTEELEAAHLALAHQFVADGSIGPLTRACLAYG